MLEYEWEKRSDICELINIIEEIMTSKYLKIPLKIIKKLKIKEYNTK